MSAYRHRQTGKLILWIVGSSVLLLGLLLVFVEAHPIGVGVMLLLVVALALFPTLTVEVNEANVTLRFGPGLIRKSFPLGSIRSARAVRNEWYFGWGIHMLPNGWLYNVSGLDAVELEMTDGRVHRIGTDEPSELLRAIRDAGQMARGGSDREGGSKRSHEYRRP